MLVLVAGSVLPLCGGSLRVFAGARIGIATYTFPVCRIAPCSALVGDGGGVRGGAGRRRGGGVWGLRVSRARGWRRVLAGVGLGVAGYLATASLAGLIMAVAMRYPVSGGFACTGRDYLATRVDREEQNDAQGEQRDGGGVADWAGGWGIS